MKTALKDAVVIDKPTFGSKILAEEITKIAEKEDITVTLVGLCTDICVVSNAILIKAYLPEIPVKVIASCCAGVTPESHEGYHENVSGAGGVNSWRVKAIIAML